MPYQAGKARILVTGGAGYVGSHVCKVLHRAGYSPVVYDNLSLGHRSAVLWGELVVGDLTDPKALSKAFTEHQPTAVIHLASNSRVGESIQDPALYYRNGVYGTLCLLDAMRAAKVGMLVFSGSCAIYGPPSKLPLDESAELRPISPYGRMKKMIEEILDDYGRAYGIRAISLRYFNAAGADPDGEIGESHTPETHLIPILLEAALGEREYVPVFGKNYPTPDGTCVRDYVHVTDLAQAHLLALEKLKAGGGSQQFNLGSERGYSVMEVIQAAEKVTGKKITLRIEGPRAGDPPTLVSDSRLAREQLGWKPEYPELERMVQSAWAWAAASGRRRSRSASE